MQPKPTAGKKAEAEAKKRQEEEDDEEDEGEEDEEEDEAGDYSEKLKAAFKRLKSSKELVYNFIVCDAKPQCGFIISKQRISAKHKAQLTEITGSKRFLKPGTCHVAGGKLVFEMEKAPPGLAAKLKKSFKYFTGISTGVILGDQSDEDEDEDQPAAGAEAAQSQSTAAGRPGQPATEEQEGQQPAAEEQEARPAGADAPQPASKRQRATLEKAPEVWHQTQREIEGSIDQLKAAIRQEFTEEGPDLIAEIDQNMAKLDGILDTLDDKLADSLTKAHAAANPEARASELKNAKTILADYIKYVKSEPMIAHIDANPFGVKINLRKTLTDSLTHMAQAIG